jgi:hypothetical protein
VRHFFRSSYFQFRLKKSFLAGGDPALLDGNNKLREGNCLGEKWLTMTRPSSSAALLRHFTQRPSDRQKMFVFFVGGKLLCVDVPARLGMIHVPR